MLAASGCHKDSFDFDEFTRPTAATPDDGTELPSSTRTPNIGIFSPPTAQEGEQLVLMITSDADAPEGGLVVMFEISGATDGEFTTTPASACPNLVCTVRILEGNRVGNLVLMPTSDSAMENSEEWTATLVDGGSNYNFAANNNVAFDITDPPTPGPTTPDPMMTLPVVGIATGDMPIEGGAGVTLTITSSETVPDTLTGGLAVTVSIRDANANEFTANAVCTNLVCIVNIPAGGNSVSLILTPLSDFSTEPGERWTATLEDGSNYNLDAGNNNVGFDITDLIAAVGIRTLDTARIEGGAVTLTITSDLAAPANGLSVTVNIVGANADEFTANAEADCTGSECVVIIPVGGMTVSLILTPLSDFSAEPGERWTATLVDTGAYDPATGDENAGFDIDDLIAALGIATSNTEIIEGGAAVTLTITSTLPVPAALTDGLSVTINIVGAGNADFTSADCTNTQCVITIPIGMTAGTLTIMASTDSDAEGGSETWTATIAPDMFTVDSDAVIAVANMLPPVADDTMLTALNAYATPTALSVNAMRAGVESASVGAIGGFQYNDADGNPRVLVERLDFANLGIWINGDITAADFNFAPLNVNVVTPPTTTSALPTATYDLEGEMTYNGNRFYPDGALMADFANAEVSGEISLDGQEAADDFGGTTLADGTTAITNSDNLTLGLNAAGISGGFSGALNIITAEGFFASLSGTGTYSGRFNDDIPNYNAATATPQEVSGIFGGITDANGNTLNGGFLGQCSADCRLPNIIGISSSADTIQEGGQVVLLITSSIAAPTGGLTVTINIGVADATEFTSGTPPQCNGLVCEVVIAATEMSAELTLTALSGDEAENVEMWTATIEPDTAIFNVDSANDDATFSIADDTFSLAVNGRTLAELNALITPTTLAADAIRNLQSDAVRGVAITASRYGDAAAPDVFVQMLEFAALGIWVNGNAPDIGVFDHINYDYAFLGDNAVATLPNSGSANYDIEGDATYKGVNFFPDGVIGADFATGDVVIIITAVGSSAVNRADDFGDANAMVPMTGSGMRPVTNTDTININFNGTIIGNEFQGTPMFTADGFFSDLAGFDSAASSFSGRFYDSVPNPATAPRELAGVMEIVDDDGNLNMGFLGRRP